MRIYREATRIRCGSLAAVLLIGGLFLMLPERAIGQDKGGGQAAAFSDTELDELVGPIALYPDKLIAIVLPASTYPLEVVQADRLLKKNKNKMSDESIKELDFDTSILALMHYPDALDKMSENLDWTTNLGDAVANQQEEVMAAVQRFRSQAMDAGNLINDEKVVYQEEATTIVIVSANPEVIYVPTYNPTVVIVKHDQPSTVVTFATGVAVGAWLSYGCNWHSHNIDIDVHGHRGYWGGHRSYGHIHGGVWGTNPGRRAAARTGARAGARAGYRTGRTRGTRQGYRAGYRAGQRNDIPRANSGNRSASGQRATNRSQNRAGRRDNAPRTGRADRTRGTGGKRATDRSADRSPGRAKPRKQARSTKQRSGKKAYGGYKSGRSARSNSARGSRSRGGGGRSRGGGRRR